MQTNAPYIEVIGFFLFAVACVQVASAASFEAQNPLPLLHLGQKGSVTYAFVLENATADLYCTAPALPPVNWAHLRWKQMTVGRTSAGIEGTLELEVTPEAEGTHPLPRLQLNCYEASSERLKSEPSPRFVLEAPEIQLAVKAPGNLWRVVKGLVLGVLSVACVLGFAYSWKTLKRPQVRLRQTT